MKARSIATLREHLHPHTKDIYEVTRDFGLSVGNLFTVYGISIWKGVMHYLVVDINDPKPDWFPAELFLVENALLPNEMYFKYFGLGDKRGVNSLWGYKEMVLDDQHYIDLIEREPKAIELFLKRKMEMDEMYDNQKDEPAA